MEKVIFENMERFQEKYDRKIEKRTQPHLNMRRSTNPVCSDVFGSIKDQIVNRTAEHGHLETMSLFDTPSDVNKMEKMNLFDSANKEEKQPDYIWEKTAITLEVFNNLLVPNWKTEKGLDRYLKTIGTNCIMRKSDIVGISVEILKRENDFMDLELYLNNPEIIGDCTVVTKAWWEDYGIKRSKQPVGCSEFDVDLSAYN